jgi:hypothetical protein
MLLYWCKSTTTDANARVFLAAPAAPAATVSPTVSPEHTQNADAAGGEGVGNNRSGGVVEEGDRGRGEVTLWGGQGGYKDHSDLIGDLRWNEASAVQNGYLLLALLDIYY